MIHTVFTFAAVLATRAGNAITPPVDGLGGSLGQYIDGDGRIASQDPGIALVLAIAFVLLALLAGIAAGRAGTSR
jgi:hypothetical protein